jgi:4-hydroxybenzoate polyprenyltransferase
MQTIANGASVALARPSLKPPLCVDLDDSLVAADLLWESFLAAVKRRPVVLLLVPFWLLRGRAYLKARLAKRADLRVDLLPYRKEVVSYIRDERQAGRTVWLVTASDSRLAKQISLHLGIFDQVVSSNGTLNLKGAVKAEFLRQQFGHEGFSYLGDSRSDVAVWKEAASALVVSGSTSLVQEAAQVTDVEKHFTVSQGKFTDVLRALRLHHWSKNILLFLPVLLAHKLQAQLLLREVAAFVGFGLAASGVYVLNDLFDIQSDRQHPWKASRPFAAGTLSMRAGLLLFLLLCFGSLAGSWFLLGAPASLLLFCYSALSIAYSVSFKRIALADVFILASFYTFRILTGGVIAPVRLSAWFIVFSGLFFFSLAAAKRYSELVHAEVLVVSGNSGRAYRVGDRSLLSELGIASAFAAIVIFCLYTQSADVMMLYARPSFLLAVAPLVLFWVARLWLRAHRGELNEDPILLAFKDPMSYCVGLGIVMLVGLATLR